MDSYQISKAVVVTPVSLSELPVILHVELDFIHKSVGCMNYCIIYFTLGHLNAASVSPHLHLVLYVYLSHIFFKNSFQEKTFEMKLWKNC